MWGAHVIYNRRSLAGGWLDGPELLERAWTLCGLIIDCSARYTES